VADAARSLWLRALGPLARPLVRDRELRVSVAGSALLALAFALTLVAPLWLLALGPIVWGVPHVLSDVRYLWVRPGHHRRWGLWVAVGLPLAALSVTADPTYGFLAATGAALCARGSLPRKLLAVALGLGLVATSRLAPWPTTVVFAHAHNFIGLALWWSWRRRRSGLHALPLAVFALGAIAILSGGIDQAVRAAGGLEARAAGADLVYHLQVLAAGLPDALGVRLVLLFAFAQAAHYVVWVRLVPEEDRPRETPRTFAASLRALVEDLGAPLVALVALASLGLAIWAAFDLFAAREGYLRAILFHGHLELAAAALLFVAGARPGAATAERA
jgi:hypothetical protein